MMQCNYFPCRTLDALPSLANKISDFVKCVCMILLNDFVFADFILISLSSQQGGVILH